MRIIYSLLFGLLFIQCSKEKKTEPLTPTPTNTSGQFCFDGGFPTQGYECQVEVIDFEASYGTTQKDSFVYDNQNRLTERYFYYNGSYNSFKVYEYSDSCSTIYGYGDNNQSGNRTLLYQLVYQNKRLVHYFHFDPNSADTLQHVNYIYKSGKLAHLKGNGDVGKIEGDVFIDARGNVERIVITKVNGSVPSPKPEISYKYSNILNPHYHLPDFVNDYQYFSPYVCEEIVGEHMYTLKPNAKNLLQTHIDSFSQGLHTSEYSYRCP